MIIRKPINIRVLINEKMFAINLTILNIIFLSEYKMCWGNPALK